MLDAHFALQDQKLLGDLSQLEVFVNQYDKMMDLSPNLTNSQSIFFQTYFFVKRSWNANQMRH